MSFITTPLRTSFFEPGVDDGSKVSSKKQHSNRRKKKDRSSSVVIPHIKKPNDDYTPLVELLKKAPPRQVAAMGANVVFRLMNGHVGSALTTGAQGVMGLWAGKPSENAAESADASTDNADKNGLAAFFSDNEATRPFAFRLKRLTRAIRDYINGQESGTQLAWEFGKVGLIVGGALAALGISIVTAGGFEGLLRAAAIPAAMFSSLTSFSIPTLIQSLTAATPLAFSFLSAAHVIADQLMQHDQDKEFSEDTQALAHEMEKQSKAKLKTVRSELNKAVEQAFKQHHNVLRNNSVDEVARKAFLKTYRQNWANFAQRDPVKAKAAKEKIRSLVTENPAIKSKAHGLWEKLHCWAVLNDLTKKFAKQPSQQHIRKVVGSMPRSFRNYLNVDKYQLPYAAMIMREKLQEEVEKEIGVKLNRKTGQVFNAETRKEVELDEAYIRARLKDYQKRIFLGGYLAGHYSSARKGFPELWAESDERIQEVVQKRCSGQVRSLTGFLLQMTVRQIVSGKQVASKSDTRNLRIEDMGQLKAVLKKQLSFLKKTVGVFEGSV